MAGKHIVDVLIEERCPRLATSPFWPLLRPALYLALNYTTARALADAIALKSGEEALEIVSRLLHVKIEATGLERLPSQGRCVVVANHPTGIADGIAVYDLVKASRPDVIFFANADAIRVCPRFAENLIPVEWVLEKRSLEKTKQTLRVANEAFAAERPVMIFPAGRLAKRIDGVIQEPPWEPSAVSLARKHKAPVIPIHVSGPYPLLFHAFDTLPMKELRDITLFHELLNKAGKTYRMTVGAPIAFETLAGDATTVSDRLKTFTAKTLGANPDAEFAPK